MFKPFNKDKDKNKHAYIILVPITVPNVETEDFGQNCIINIPWLIATQI